MSKIPFYENEVDKAIIKALGLSGKPLRYNELHRRADKNFGRRIYIKTFNDHLRKLYEKAVVIRSEKNRYHVTYELVKEYSDILFQGARARMVEDIEVIMEHPAVQELVKELADVKKRLAFLDNPELIEKLKALLGE